MMNMMMNLMARTPSVKWRLHNHAHRSRSMETVLCSERFYDDDVDDGNDGDDYSDYNGDYIQQQNRLMRSHNTEIYPLLGINQEQLRILWNPLFPPLKQFFTLPSLTAAGAATSVECPPWKTPA